MTHHFNQTQNTIFIYIKYYKYKMQGLQSPCISFLSYPFQSLPVLQLVASSIVPHPVQSYIAYIRCIKIRTMVVLYIVSMYQFYPFRGVPSTGSMYQFYPVRTYPCQHLTAQLPVITSIVLISEQLAEKFCC